MKALGLVAASTLVVATIGCSSGIQHSVRPGENLYRIGKAYDRDYKRLARINGIAKPYTIKVGQKLYIPGANRQLPVSVITPRSASAAKPKAATPVRTPPKTTPKTSAPSKLGFAWPVKGRVSSSFGKRGGGHHDGIDILAPTGVQVVAAREGKVIYSDRLSGYGNVVIVEHEKGYTSVYAHNDRNLVNKGSRIRRGQKIATVGASGRATAPHLHFEIRKDNVARNPLYYLPR